MAFHYIITCVSQKRARKSHSILDPEIRNGTLDAVFKQWNNLLLNSSLRKRKAIALYKGQLWDAFLDGWGIINNQLKNSQLWILSAGYGLIKSDQKIVPYDITFQESRNGSPSVQYKVESKDGMPSRRDIIQGWWRLLTCNSSSNHPSIMSLTKNAKKDDFFFLVLGKDYLDAVFLDISSAIRNSNYPENITVLSNNVNDPLAKKLGEQWLYADSRLVNLTGSNNTTVNAKIAKELLWHMFHEKSGLRWWSFSNFNAYLKEVSSNLPDVKKHNRESNTDEEIKAYITKAVKYNDIAFTNLHRSFRDSGKACEYSRFQSLYKQVKRKLQNETQLQRPHFPVEYTPRQAKMMFFLPDWDDRVDPNYDFYRDEPTANRDPYLYDTYHYELYGTLNCDGILVSKSVLEGNPEKKRLAKKSGIHNYLRLPPSVPVLGDCGAFNYIAKVNPPFDTDEILKYYTELGFNYGVSIDHLIVPGILKRNRYFKIDKEGREKISEEEFKILKDNPEVRILSNREYGKQRNFFLAESLSLLKETYIDEQERQRRYDLTMDNAKLFINGHRRNNCNFVPIGAVQGWDPDSYAYAVKEYQKMGYNYIALGGLVKSKTKDIMDVLDSIDRIRKTDTRLHVFGVARLEAVDSFMEYGVSSVDSAGVLRQAWLSSKNNYYSLKTDDYAAIRIPIASKGRFSRQATQLGLVKKEELSSLEELCLSAIRKYDLGEISVEQTLDILEEYGKLMGGTDDLFQKYKRTLADRPWEECPCKICRNTGIDVLIFRRNNRNRRRGFHNTWVFFKKFKELTNIT